MRIRTSNDHEMQSNQELIGVHYILRVFHSVNSLCFHYDETIHRLIPLKPTSKQFWFSVIALMYSVTHSVFQIIRFFQISVKHNPVQLIVLDIVWISGYGVCTVFYCHLFSRRNQVEDFTNMFVLFEESLNCMYIII